MLAPYELIGDSRAELYGYLPEISGVNAVSQIVRIDRASAEILDTYPIAGLPKTARDYAFVSWGGKFYIFHRGQPSLGPDYGTEKTSIYKVEGIESDTPWEAALFMEEGGMNIVAADKTNCTPAY